MARIEEMRADGPMGLVLRLREGDPDLPFHLADPRLVVGPGGRLEGVGTGLYRLARDQAPGRLRLDRVAAHWKDGRAGWFDAVEARWLPDPRARLDAGLAGEVDAIDPLPPMLLAEARAAGLMVAEAAGPRQLHVRWPEGADPALAALLPRAVDRLPLALGWGGAPAADHPLGPAHTAFAADIAAPAFDPEVAAWLGRRAGLDLARDLVLAPWQGRATEDATFAAAVAGPWRVAAPALAALLGTGAKGTDLWREAQRVAAGAGVVVVAHLPQRTPHAARLGHDAVSGLGPLDAGRLAERWWLIA